MKSLVIYATRSGNTRTVAETIAAVMRKRGSAEIFDAEHAPPTLPESDLIFIGGPTEQHTLTPPIVDLFERLAPGSLRGRATAAFDTRMQWPRLLSGSAADEIAKRMRAADARVVARPQSFFVRSEPRLGYEIVPGELARVAAWADETADRVREASAIAG